MDETGDGVIFDSKGRMLVGTGRAQDYFTVGMVECRTLDALTADLASLRAELIADPYFKNVPSMHPEANKTAVFFHAKDDLPEVRREVFKVVERHDLLFHAVVRTMSAVARMVRERNEQDPAYRYHPTELYDSAVRQLFDNKLHSQPAFDVVFASRGKSRTNALRAHLLKAQAASQKTLRTFPNAGISVKAMPSQNHIGLQVTDYCLWALQRFFTKREDRFLSLIWPKVGLIVDADDTSEQPHGTHYSQNRILPGIK
ncbi:MAG: DUF3800 domain-containing protein [Candidatus Kapabacteria bacterium]|nr:DUF3800 domain-containing protein [Candidatus Kapabacteria bacterium]